MLERWFIDDRCSLIASTWSCRSICIAPSFTDLGRLNGDRNQIDCEWFFFEFFELFSCLDFYIDFQCHSRWCIGCLYRVMKTLISDFITYDFDLDLPLIYVVSTFGFSAFKKFNDFGGFFIDCSFPFSSCSKFRL